MTATKINVATAKTSELVAFYNANTDKPVKKFADRATAEKRVAALLETLQPVKTHMSRAERAAQCAAGAKKAMHQFSTQKEALGYAEQWSAASRNRKAVCRVGNGYLVCSQMTTRKYGYEVLARV